MDGCFEDYNGHYRPATYQNNDAPVPAGTVRFLFGLLMMFVGFYIGAFSEIHGHGLGFLMVLGSPFILLTDRKREREISNIL